MITVFTKITLIILSRNLSHKIKTFVLYIKGVCRNCNIYISDVKNNNCYDIKIVHRYNVDILILKSRRVFASP